jgi:hypothetical protein
MVTSIADKGTRVEHDLSVLVILLRTSPVKKLCVISESADFAKEDSRI